MDRTALQKIIGVAAGDIPADTVIQNGVIADVFSGQFAEASLAIADGLVAAVIPNGECDAREIIDAGGRYVLPGFIDSHIHIESTFLTPPELGRILVPLGTSTIISDPHEIVNVCGLAGMDYMLSASEDIALDIKFMAPSCVPCSPFEHSGASLDAAALEKPLAEARVIGLGEMMNYPGVVGRDEAVLDKLVAARRAGKFIDGHAPGLRGRALAAYAAGMIRTDHECASVDEMNGKIALGMYVLLREGSACHDLANLLPGVTPHNSRRCILCTDDCQPETLFELGHLDHLLRMCVERGLDPMTAVRMVTLNAAECYGLSDRGGFAPGMRADAVLVDSLKDFRAREVYIRGKLAARDGRFLAPANRQKTDDSALRSSFHVKDFSADKLALPLSSDEAWVIDVRPGSVATGKGKAAVRRDSAGNFAYDAAGGNGVAKIAVIERHRGTGNAGLGLIRGYGIRRGAIAVSVAHDSHNIIAAGMNDADMARAVLRLIELGGGAVLALDGGILAEMPLPLGGLLSDQSGARVRDNLKAVLRCAVETLGVRRDIEPLLTLSFMSLPVIPELKITDMGIFDTASLAFIPVSV